MTATGATIAWTASTDDVGVTGYQVFRNGTPVPGHGYWNVIYRYRSCASDDLQLHGVGIRRGGKQFGAVQPAASDDGGGGDGAGKRCFAGQRRGGLRHRARIRLGLLPPVGANNGDRKGVNWSSGGGWNDATLGAFPDWLQISFNGVQSIGEIDVFTVQDNYGQRRSNRRPSMTFTQYGISAFQVQYLNGSTWVDVPGGNVTGNNLVWRKFTFARSAPMRIRVLVNAGAERLFAHRRGRGVDGDGWLPIQRRPRFLPISRHRR